MEMGASSSFSLFKFALVALLLTLPPAPALARARPTLLDRDQIETAEKKAVEVMIPYAELLMNKKGLKNSCVPASTLCDPKGPEQCCDGECVTLFFAAFCI